MELIKSEPGWKQRRIEGFSPMTDTMFHVLTRLQSGKDYVGYLWLSLDDVHGATVAALQRNDWIVESSGLDGVKYQITGRGVKALKIYSLPLAPRRRDGVCPNCGVRPVAYSETGNCHGYCWECSREYKKRQRYSRGGSMRTPGKPCPQCGIRPVHTTASGFVQSYCVECKNERAKAERQRKHERKLARIAAGEFIPCCRCKEKRVYVLGKHVYDYCHECYRAYQNEYNSRRRGRRERE